MTAPVIRARAHRMSPLLLVLAVWALLSVLVVAGLCLLLHGRSAFNRAPARRRHRPRRTTARRAARTPSSEPAAWPPVAGHFRVSTGRPRDAGARWSRS